jgi:hypothetical protein
MVNSLLLTDYNFAMKMNVLIFRYFLEKSDGRRQVGRPNVRWLDCNEYRVKSRDVKRCRNKAEDRSARGIIVNEGQFTL